MVSKGGRPLDDVDCHNSTLNVGVPIFGDVGLRLVYLRNNLHKLCYKPSWK
jgi:hypothetical protein